MRWHRKKNNHSDARQQAWFSSHQTVRIGGIVANVAWAGLVSSGMYQFNVVVPEAPDVDQPVVAEIAGYRTQDNAFITVLR